MLYVLSYVMFTVSCDYSAYKNKTLTVLDVVRFVVRYVAFTVSCDYIAAIIKH